MSVYLIPQGDEADLQIYSYDIASGDQANFELLESVGGTQVIGVDATTLTSYAEANLIWMFNVIRPIENISVEENVEMYSPNLPLLRIQTISVVDIVTRIGLDSLQHLAIQDVLVSEVVTARPDRLFIGEVVQAISVIDVPEFYIAWIISTAVDDVAIVEDVFVLDLMVEMWLAEDAISVSENFETWNDWFNVWWLFDNVSHVEVAIIGFEIFDLPFRFEPLITVSEFRALAWTWYDKELAQDISVADVLERILVGHFPYPTEDVLVEDVIKIECFPPYPYPIDNVLISEFVGFIIQPPSLSWIAEYISAPEYIVVGQDPHYANLGYQNIIIQDVPIISVVPLYVSVIDMEELIPYVKEWVYWSVGFPIYVADWMHPTDFLVEIILDALVPEGADIVSVSETIEFWWDAYGADAGQAIHVSEFTNIAFTLLAFQVSLSISIAEDAVVEALDADKSVNTYESIAVADVYSYLLINYLQADDSVSVDEATDFLWIWLLSVVDDIEVTESFASFLSVLNISVSSSSTAAEVLIVGMNEFPVEAFSEISVAENIVPMLVHQIPVYDEAWVEDVLSIDLLILPFVYETLHVQEVIEPDLPLFLVSDGVSAEEWVMVKSDDIPLEIYQGVSVSEWLLFSVPDFSMVQDIAVQDQFFVDLQSYISSLEAVLTVQEYLNFTWDYFLVDRVHVTEFIIISLPVLNKTEVVNVEEWIYIDLPTIIAHEDVHVEEYKDLWGAHLWIWQALVEVFSVVEFVPHLDGADLWFAHDVAPEERFYPELIGVSEFVPHLDGAHLWFNADYPEFRFYDENIFTSEFLFRLDGANLWFNHDLPDFAFNPEFIGVSDKLTHIFGPHMTLYYEYNSSWGQSWWDGEPEWKFEFIPEVIGTSEFLFELTGAHLWMNHDEGKIRFNPESVSHQEFLFELTGAHLWFNHELAKARFYPEVFSISEFVPELTGAHLWFNHELVKAHFNPETVSVSEFRHLDGLQWDIYDLIDTVSIFENVAVFNKAVGDLHPYESVQVEEWTLINRVGVVDVADGVLVSDVADICLPTLFAFDNVGVDEVATITNSPLFVLAQEDMATEEWFKGENCWYVDVGDSVGIAEIQTYLLLDPLGISVGESLGALDIINVLPLFVPLYIVQEISVYEVVTTRGNRLDLTAQDSISVQDFPMVGSARIGVLVNDNVLIQDIGSTVLVSLVSVYDAISIAEYAERMLVLTINVFDGLWWTQESLVIGTNPQAVFAFEDITVYSDFPWPGQVSIPLLSFLAYESITKTEVFSQITDNHIYRNVGQDILATEWVSLRPTLGVFAVTSIHAVDEVEYVTDQWNNVGADPVHVDEFVDINFVHRVSVDDDVVVQEFIVPDGNDYWPLFDQFVLVREAVSLVPSFGNISLIQHIFKSEFVDVCIDEWNLNVHDDIGTYEMWALSAGAMGLEAVFVSEDADLAVDPTFLEVDEAIEVSDVFSGYSFLAGTIPVIGIEEIAIYPRFEIVVFPIGTGIQVDFAHVDEDFQYEVGTMVQSGDDVSVEEVFTVEMQGRFINVLEDIRPREFVIVAYHKDDVLEPVEGADIDEYISLVLPLLYQTSIDNVPTTEYAIIREALWIKEKPVVFNPDGTMTPPDWKPLEYPINIFDTPVIAITPLYPKVGTDRLLHEHISVSENVLLTGANMAFQSVDNIKVNEDIDGGNLILDINVFENIYPTDKEQPLRDPNYDPNDSRFYGPWWTPDRMTWASTVWMKIPLHVMGNSLIVPAEGASHYFPWEWTRLSGAEQLWIDDAVDNYFFTSWAWWCAHPELQDGDVQGNGTGKWVTFGQHEGQYQNPNAIYKLRKNSNSWGILTTWWVNLQVVLDPYHAQVVREEQFFFIEEYVNVSFAGIGQAHEDISVDMAVWLALEHHVQAIDNVAAVENFATTLWPPRVSVIEPIVVQDVCLTSWRPFEAFGFDEILSPTDYAWASVLFVGGLAFHEDIIIQDLAILSRTGEAWYFGIAELWVNVAEWAVLGVNPIQLYPTETVAAQEYLVVGRSITDLETASNIIIAEAAVLGFPVLTIVIQDTVATQESQTSLLPYLRRLVSDAVAVSETSTLSSHIDLPIHDHAYVTETVLRYIPISIFNVDDISVEDFDILGANLKSSVFDNVPVVEAFESFWLFYALHASDAVSVTEMRALARGLARSVSDSVAASEWANFGFSELEMFLVQAIAVVEVFGRTDGEWEIAAFDTVHAAEAFLKAWWPRIEVVQNVLASEWAIQRPSPNLSIVQAISLAEAVYPLVSPLILALQGVSVVERAWTGIWPLIEAYEAVTAQERAWRDVDVQNIEVWQAFWVAEVVNAGLPWLGMVVNEAVALDAVLDIDTVFLVSVFEAFGVAENATPIPAIDIFKWEAVSKQENLGVGLEYFLLGIEAITLSEYRRTDLIILYLSMAASDGASVSEYGKAGLNRLYFSASTDVSVTEFWQVWEQYYFTAFDNVAAADASILDAFLQLFRTEAVHATESFSRYVGIQFSAEESFSVEEFHSVLFPFLVIHASDIVVTDWACYTKNDYEIHLHEQFVVTEMFVWGLPVQFIDAAELVRVDEVDGLYVPPYQIYPIFFDAPEHGA